MSGPFDAERDSNAGVGTGNADYQPGVPDETLAAFGAGALAADQRPTAGHEQPQEASGYSYPVPHTGSRLGF
jgi:hypothetical protein